MTAYNARYPQNRCVRFGQSRFGPVKRTALDNKVWWFTRDFREHKYVPWHMFRFRRQAIAQLLVDLQHNWLPYEPDPGFSRDWLESRPFVELASLMKQKPSRRTKWNRR